MSYYFWFTVVCLLFGSAEVSGSWDVAFVEQNVFSGKYCNKHMNRAYTDFGLNYRLDNDGEYIWRTENTTGREFVKGRVNHPKHQSLSKCSTDCSNNSLCTAFAHRARDGLCQHMTHCEMDDAYDKNFRYFVRSHFGCHRVQAVMPGLTCNKNHSSVVVSTSGVTLVEECMELAVAHGGVHFSLDGNIYCTVWDECVDPHVDLTTTLYEMNIDKSI